MNDKTIKTVAIIAALGLGGFALYRYNTGGVSSSISGFAGFAPAPDYVPPNTDQMPVAVDSEGQLPAEPVPPKLLDIIRIVGSPTNPLKMPGEFTEGKLIGNSDSWYDRRNIKEDFGWTPTEYQAGWERIIGEVFGGTGSGKVAYPAESRETGLPMMSNQEFVAYGYGNMAAANARKQPSSGGSNGGDEGGGIGDEGGNGDSSVGQMEKTGEAYL